MNVGVWALPVALISATAGTRTSREVANCPDGGGRIVLVSPSPGETVPPTVPIELQADRPGGVPFTLGIDGVGFAARRDGRLVPRPNRNPGCPPEQRCWPQLGAGGPNGPFRSAVVLPTGVHVIEIRPGVQGTDLPTFDAFSVRFRVAEPLANTGWAPGWSLAGALALVGLGLGLLIGPWSKNRL